MDTAINIVSEVHHPDFGICPGNANGTWNGYINVVEFEDERLVDTRGGGIKKMYVNQIKRFFPLPDYDFNDGKQK